MFGAMIEVIVILALMRFAFRVPNPMLEARCCLLAGLRHRHLDRLIEGNSSRVSLGTWTCSPLVMTRTFQEIADAQLPTA